MNLYAITSISQSKTFFIMKVGAETRAGESHPSSPQRHLFSEGPATFGRSLKEGKTSMVEKKPNTCESIKYPADTQAQSVLK